jgi:hypothetical protein
MNSSKHFIAIQEGNRSIRVMESKFEREVGFVINVEGTKFKVCELFNDKKEAGHFMYVFKPHLFNFFNYNTKTGRN